MPSAGSVLRKDLRRPYNTFTYGSAKKVKAKRVVNHLRAEGVPQHTQQSICKDWENFGFCLQVLKKKSL